MAILAVREHADALDLVQDAMFKLVDKYHDRPVEQWKPLFYKILQNRIRDWQRHSSLKRALFFWKSDEQESEEQHWADESPGRRAPEQDMEKAQQTRGMLEKLEALPEKQHQCFLLRSWEGFSVAHTAEIMGCSQGSVKTHFFRAVTKLREELGDNYDVKI